MTIQEFMTLNGISDPAFAAMIGRDRTTVLRLRRGDTKPDWQTLAAIRDATGGKVMPDDFLDAKPRKESPA